jgi:hypothetical protein
MPPYKPIIVVSISTLIAFIRSTPSNIQEHQFLAFLTIMIDTIFGIACAITCKELKSFISREKMTVKLLQYSACVTVGYAAVILAHAWFVLSGIYFWIMCTEMRSWFEKMYRMEKYGGIKFGGFSPIINVLGGMFEVDTATVVNNAIVIPADKTQPIINVQTIDTLRKPTSKEKEEAHNALDT